MGKFIGKYWSSQTCLDTNETAYFVNRLWNSDKLWKKMITSSDVEKKIPQRKLKTIYTCFDPLGKRGLKKNIEENKDETRKNFIHFVYRDKEEKQKQEQRRFFFFRSTSLKRTTKKIWDQHITGKRVQLFPN